LLDRSGCDMKKYERCVFIMADGARDDLFRYLLNNGDLPNISNYVVENGSYKTAVSVFPSTTGPAYTPTLLGKFPGRCNFPGIRWFDRSVYSKKLFSINRFRSYIGPETYLMNRDISSVTPTLFEIFPNSINILNELTKGISNGGDKTKLRKIYLKIKGHFTGSCDQVDETATEILLDSIKHMPDLIYVVFLGIDTYSHIKHPFHDKVIDSYKRIDRSVGLLCERLRLLGALEDTLIVLVSDHGLTQTHSHFDTIKFFDTKGYKTFYYPNVFRNFLSADLSVMVSGNSMAHVYIKHNGSWNYRSRFENLEKLVYSLNEREEIDIISVRDNDNKVRIISERGECITWLDEDGHIHYQRLKDDPLGLNFPEKMNLSDFLRLSCETNYPDSLLQIIQLFESPRSGDIILSAKEGYDLRSHHENPEHSSSHGSLISDHMLVPLVINERIDCENIRTVDIYPTILNMMGVSIPNDVDGKVLV